MKKFIVFLFFSVCFSAFAFQLSLNLKKGDKFIYTIKKNQIMVLGSKETAYRNNTEISLIFEVKVLEWSEKSFKMSFLLKRGVLTIVSPLGANKFDTEISKGYPKNPFLAMLIEMKKTPLIYTFDRKNLKVKKAEGILTLQNRVIKNMNFKNKMLEKRLKEILNKKSKEMETGYGLDFNLFPYLNRDVVEGKQFEVKQFFLEGDTKINANVVYKVEKITDNFVFFKIDSLFNVPATETSFNGLKAISSVKGKQSGSLTVYRDTGLPNFYSVEQSIEGVFIIKDTKERFPVKVNSVVIIRFQREN